MHPLHYAVTIIVMAHCEQGDRYLYTQAPWHGTQSYFTYSMPQCNRLCSHIVGDTLAHIIVFSMFYALYYIVSMHSSHCLFTIPSTAKNIIHGVPALTNILQSEWARYQTDIEILRYTTNDMQ